MLISAGTKSFLWVSLMPEKTTKSVKKNVQWPLGWTRSDGAQENTVVSRVSDTARLPSPGAQHGTARRVSSDRARLAPGNKNLLSWTAISELLKNSYLEWSGDKGPRLGAALAYYAIFSLAPSS